MEKLLLNVAEAAEVLGLSKSIVYSLIWSGALRSVKVGTVRRVPAAALREYVKHTRHWLADVGWSASVRCAAAASLRSVAGEMPDAAG